MSDMIRVVPGGRLRSRDIFTHFVTTVLERTEQTTFNVTEQKSIMIKLGKSIKRMHPEQSKTWLMHARDIKGRQDGYYKDLELSRQIELVTRDQRSVNCQRCAS